MTLTTRTRTIAASLAAVLALGGLAACGSSSSSSSTATTGPSGKVAVSDAWARESAMSSGDGALYLTVENGTSTDDELTAVSVPTSVAAEAQIHETVAATDDTMAGGMSSDTTAMKSGAGADGGTHATLGLVHEGEDEGTDTTMAGDPMMTMREVASVPVPAGGTVKFEPGGYHVMLIDLASPLKEGQTFEATLTFAQAGKVTVTVTVRSA
jgi:copper(I)-binding protein